MSNRPDYWCARLAVICLPLLGGCMSPWSLRAEPDPLASSRLSGDSLPAMPIAAEQPIQSPSSVTTAKSLSSAVVLTTDQEIALNHLVAEVRATRTLSATAEHQLRVQLRHAHQDEWPLVVKNFRSTLAYRDELLARETQSDAAIHHASYTPSSPSHVQEAEQTATAIPQPEPTAPVHQVQLASHTAPVNLPTRGTIVANVSKDEPATPSGEIPNASPSMSGDADWRSKLASTIDSMRHEVKPNPTSTDELQQHMRLRMLMLTAGLENDSLAPIPGATPTEQDYWSKQLFALSTYLDSERQPDKKQRAAGSLMHLDAARAKLAELATLEVRNLSFVDSVEGYGLYDVHEEAKFKPGDQVRLYAEVENFRSESTKEGYRTVLATSYEVVDSQGHRVDGAQFLDVEDVCRNHRRDFHMQYGIALPTRIYPGTYELRLIITDQLSQKIGQTAVSFEIVE